MTPGGLLAGQARFGKATTVRARRPHVRALTHTARLFLQPQTGPTCFLQLAGAQPCSAVNAVSRLMRQAAALHGRLSARAILENDLFESLVRAVDTLPLGGRRQFASALQRVLGQVALERGLQTLGNCASCTHLEGDDCSRERQPSYACGFSSEPLRLDELDGICINFVQGSALQERGALIGTAPRWVLSQ